MREADERNARISWKSVKGAQGYNVLWGVALDKLYSSWMVYGDNSLDLRALTVGQKYYFAIESFNEMVFRNVSFFERLTDYVN